MSSTLPDGSDRRGRIVVVCNPFLEIRRRPDHAAECLSEAVMGSRLRILGTRSDGRWLRVLAPDGYTGWVRSWGTVETEPGWPRGGGLVVAAPMAPFRQRPGRDAPSAGVVAMGARLAGQVPPRGPFVRIRTPDGRAGWLARDAVEPDRLPASCGFWEPAERERLRPDRAAWLRASRSRLIRRAGSLLGTGYRWGGAGAGGLDCSGLVRLLFGLEGIALPRDARDQFAALEEWVRPVDPARIRLGDLVFFGSPGGGIDHVGIGAGGRPGRMVHASGLVRLSSLAEGRRGFEPDLARRVGGVVRPPWRGSGRSALDRVAPGR